MGSSVFLGCLEGWGGDREVVKHYIFLDYFPEKGFEAHFLGVRV